MDDNLRIWRSFSLGSLLDLVMLDTRQYDRSITDLYWNTDYVHAISNDAGRSMMGSRQENWFYEQLIASKQRNAVWRVIGSQTVFSRINESVAYGNVNPLDYDAWDGYQANRNRTFQTLYDNDIGNNIMISGDSHANWVSDLVWLDQHAYDPTTGDGAIGVEFAGTGKSPFLSILPNLPRTSYSLTTRTHHVSPHSISPSTSIHLPTYPPLLTFSTNSRLLPLPLRPKHLPRHIHQRKPTPHLLKP